MYTKKNTLKILNHQYYIQKIIIRNSYLLHHAQKPITRKSLSKTITTLLNNCNATVKACITTKQVAPSNNHKIKLNKIL